MNSSDINVDFDGHVALVEICRPPDNYFDAGLIGRLADIYEELDADPVCRAIVQCSRGKHFCAGFQFNKPPGLMGKEQTNQAAIETLYSHALRLYRYSKPVVTAVQGAAIGGGLGLALAADFRITCADARFSANFSRLGFHHGFGLSLTLPRLVGHSQANLMLFTGRRISGRGSSIHRIGGSVGSEGRCAEGSNSACCRDFRVSPAGCSVNQEDATSGASQ